MPVINVTTPDSATLYQPATKNEQTTPAAANKLYKDNSHQFFSQTLWTRLVRNSIGVDCWEIMAV